MKAGSGEDDVVMRMGISAAWRALADRVVAEYRAALGGDLLAVACFGSVARGQAGPESDLDLYVVTRGQVADPLGQCLGGAIRLRETREYRALAREGHRPDPMPIFHTVAKLATHPWILLDIADHGVILYDPAGILAWELEAVRRRLRELGSKRVMRPDGSWYWDLKPDWRPGETIEL
ncbi:MAG: nucleotidyltransferase domain-containing protein [Deltaproteobacteria bacterium]|nr:nucleotidyltransferase domain-containing protein [Deltaproteobacteria bacterium]